MMSRIHLFNNGHIAPRGGLIQQPYMRMSSGIGYHPIFGYGLYGGRYTGDEHELFFNIKDNLSEMDLSKYDLTTDQGYNAFIDELITENDSKIKRRDDGTVKDTGHYQDEINVLQQMKKTYNKLIGDYDPNRLENNDPYDLEKIKFVDDDKADSGYKHIIEAEQLKAQQEHDDRIKQAQQTADLKNGIQALRDEIVKFSQDSKIITIPGNQAGLVVLRRLVEKIANGSDDDIIAYTKGSKDSIIKALSKLLDTSSENPDVVNVVEKFLFKISSLHLKSSFNIVLTDTGKLKIEETKIEDEQKETSGKFPELRGLPKGVIIRTPLSTDEIDEAFNTRLPSNINANGMMELKPDNILSNLLPAVNDVLNSIDENYDELLQRTQQQLYTVPPGVTTGAGKPLEYNMFYNEPVTISCIRAAKSIPDDVSIKIVKNKTWQSDTMEKATAYDPFDGRMSYTTSQDGHKKIYSLTCEMKSIGAESVNKKTGDMGFTYESSGLTSLKTIIKGMNTKDYYTPTGKLKDTKVTKFLNENYGGMLLQGENDALKEWIVEQRNKINYLADTIRVNKKMGKNTDEQQNELKKMNELFNTYKTNPEAYDELMKEYLKSGMSVSLPLSVSKLPPPTNKSDPLAKHIIARHKGVKAWPTFNDSGKVSGFDGNAITKTISGWYNNEYGDDYCVFYGFKDGAMCWNITDLIQRGYLSRDNFYKQLSLMPSMYENPSQMNALFVHENSLLDSYRLPFFLGKFIKL